MAKTAQIYTLIVRFSMVDEKESNCDRWAGFLRDHTLELLERNGATVDDISLIAERKKL